MADKYDQHNRLVHASFYNGAVADQAANRVDIDA